MNAELDEQQLERLKDFVPRHLHQLNHKDLQTIYMATVWYGINLNIPLELLHYHQPELSESMMELNNAFLQRLPDLLCQPFIPVIGSYVDFYHPESRTIFQLLSSENLLDEKLLKADLLLMKRILLRVGYNVYQVTPHASNQAIVNAIYHEIYGPKGRQAYSDVTAAH